MTNSTVTILENKINDINVVLAGINDCKRSAQRPKLLLREAQAELSEFLCDHTVVNKHAWDTLWGATRVRTWKAYDHRLKMVRDLLNHLEECAHQDIQRLKDGTDKKEEAAAAEARERRRQRGPVAIGAASGEEGNIMPEIDKIIAYESGEMTQEEMVEFFQELIDSGMAWELQGSYGRMARALIEDGICRMP